MKILARLFTNDKTDSKEQMEKAESKNTQEEF